jgi:hypothetical protein
MVSERLAHLIERIDQLNRQDPNTELVNGVPMPRESVYSQRLTDWVLRLEPTASEALRIAARGQHIQRWTIPRDRYERNRRGYLRWRETLKTFHAQQVTELMAAVGYPDETIQQVRSLIVKRRPPDDAEAQVLEDALCLVFFETQFADLRQRTPEPAMAEALRKMWKKMSERGRAEALRLPLGEAERKLLTEAVGGIDSP